MPDDATEGLAKHSYMLQTLINFHAPGTAFMFSCSGTDVLHRRDEGSGKALGSDRKLIVYWPPLRILTWAAGFKIISGDHYTTTALFSKTTSHVRVSGRILARLLRPLSRCHSNAKETKLVIG